MTMQWGDCVWMKKKQTHFIHLAIYFSFNLWHFSVSYNLCEFMCGCVCVLASNVCAPISILYSIFIGQLNVNPIKWWLRTIRKTKFYLFSFFVLSFVSSMYKPCHQTQNTEDRPVIGANCFYFFACLCVRHKSHASNCFIWMQLISFICFVLFCIDSLVSWIFYARVLWMMFRLLLFCRHKLCSGYFVEMLYLSG